MKLLVFSILLSLSTSTFAVEKTTFVKCWVPGPYAKQETVTMKMVNGKFTYWDEKYVAKPGAMSSFGLFGELYKDSSIESVQFLTAPNDYSLAILTTTAESLTLGVSPDLKKGFLKYVDLGSGNGNDTLKLECKVLR